MKRSLQHWLSMKRPLRHWLVVKRLSFMTACGLRNPELAVDTKRSVNCLRCRQTKRFKNRGDYGE